jgi:uncharacterized protein YecE (DUF72 family)
VATTTSRGRFYPSDTPARRWLEYASRRFDTIELNGTFYSLKSPAVFERYFNDEFYALLPTHGCAFAAAVREWLH